MKYQKIQRNNVPKQQKHLHRRATMRNYSANIVRIFDICKTFSKINPEYSLRKNKLAKITEICLKSTIFSLPLHQKRELLSTI